LGITRKYIRMLPFDKEQVNSYLRLRKSGLTYNELIDKHLEHEEITKPLILSMLVMAWPELKDDVDRLSKLSKRTLIYMKIFYKIFLGKRSQEEQRRPQGQRQISFYEEKKILRAVSFLKQLKNDATLEEIENWLPSILDTNTIRN